MSYPDPSQVNRTILLRQIRDNEAATNGYVDPSTGNPVPGSNANTVGGTPRVSQGPYFVPTASTNGTELPGRPSATSGALLNVSPGASITGYKAVTGLTPSSPGSVTLTYSVPSGATGGTAFPVYLSANDSWYATAITGSVVGEWVQR